MFYNGSTLDKGEAGPHQPHKQPIHQVITFDSDQTDKAMNIVEHLVLF